MKNRDSDKSRENIENTLKKNRRLSESKVNNNELEENSAQHFTGIKTLIKIRKTKEADASLKSSKGFSRKSSSDDHRSQMHVSTNDPHNIMDPPDRKMSIEKQE